MNRLKLAALVMLVGSPILLIKECSAQTSYKIGLGATYSRLRESAQVNDVIDPLSFYVEGMVIEHLTDYISVAGVAIYQRQASALEGVKYKANSFNGGFLLKAFPFKKGLNVATGWNIGIRGAVTQDNTKVPGADKGNSQGVIMLGYELDRLEIAARYNRQIGNTDIFRHTIQFGVLYTLIH